MSFACLLFAAIRQALSKAIIAFFQKCGSGPCMYAWMDAASMSDRITEWPSAARRNFAECQGHSNNMQQ